jgi:hypothetical protein
MLDVSPAMVAPEVARAAIGSEVLAVAEYDVWCVGLLLLKLLLGPSQSSILISSSAQRIQPKGWYLTDVAQLQAGCYSSPEWLEPSVAELGGVLFGCLVAEEQQRCSADVLLQLPCFSAVPTWGELALLLRA